MGVQCTVFGHVYDGTEFEEHRKERPRGEVLICREYQVCRRCGNRTEMYRNERLLTPRDAEPEGAQGNESVGAPEPTSDARGESRNGGRDATDDGGETPLDDTAESGEDAPPDTSRVEAAPNAGSRIGDASTEESPTDERDRAAAPSTDAGRDQPPTDSSPAADPQAEDAVILTDGASDPGPSVTEVDSDGSRANELPDDAASNGGPTSPFDREVDNGEVGCLACERTWDRSVTSLRDGDICPGCKRGYVERQ